MISRSPASYFIKKVKLDSDREFDFKKNADPSFQEDKLDQKLEQSNSKIGKIFEVWVQKRDLKHFSIV